MKPLTKVVALGAACAACCALPMAAPLIAGTFAGSMLLAFGAEPLKWSSGIAVIGFAAVLLWRHQRSARALASAGATRCDCSAALRVARQLPKAELIPVQPPPLDPTVVACTLTPGDYRQRVIRIHDLAARSLRSARRDDLRLVLTYAPEAADEVRAVVREEEACCPFLKFDVADDGLGIDVTITAPEEAGASAVDLFAHFAPELAVHRSLYGSLKEDIL